jgi:hypothetical protein
MHAPSSARSSLADLLGLAVLKGLKLVQCLPNSNSYWRRKQDPGSLSLSGSFCVETYMASGSDKRRSRLVHNAYFSKIFRGCVAQNGMPFSTPIHTRTTSPTRLKRALMQPSQMKPPPTNKL